MKYVNKKKYVKKKRYFISSFYSHGIIDEYFPKLKNEYSNIKREKW